jgi:hypothetical protein
MDNNELNEKIKEIINKDNYFDMMIAAKEFENEYKKSDFYKITKKSLYEVIKENKIFYFLNVNNLIKELNFIMHNLDYTTVSNWLVEFTSVMQDNISEMQDGALLINDIVSELTK